MFIGIEYRKTKVNGRTYWRIAPLIIAIERQKLWIGSVAVILAFIFSIILLNVEKAS